MASCSHLGLTASHAAALAAEDPEPDDLHEKAVRVLRAVSSKLAPGIEKHDGAFTTIIKVQACRQC